MPINPSEVVPLIKKVEELLLSCEGTQYPMRGWVSCPAVSLYIRVSRRFIDGAAAPTLELGMINVNHSDKRDYRHRGICIAILTCLEDLSRKHRRVFYIDTVLNTDLDLHIRNARVGYVPCNGFEGTFSYYLPLPSPFGLVV